MDLSYESFKSGKSKPSKSSNALSYTAFKANKEKAAATQIERADRISKGEAVSVNKNKAAPTFVGKIVRGIVKPAVTLIARPAQAVAAAKGFTEDEQTVKSKYLGDIKTSKNAKDVVKDVGRGLEVVSNAIGVGAIKTAGANVARQGALQVAKRAAVEGLAAGAVQGIGSGVAEGKTGKDLLWEAAKSTAMGGVGGFVLGGALSKIMGTPKSLDEVAKAKAPYIVPKAGAPKLETPVELKLAENVPTDVDTKGSKIAPIAETPILPPDKTITPKGTTVPKVTVGAPKSMINDPIMSEARKYKSAEEFMRAQPKLYHGGTADIKDIQLGKSNFQKTFYMSESADYAKSYGGKSSSLNDIWLDPKAKLADLRNPDNEIITKIENVISPKPTGKNIKIQKPDGSFIEIPETIGGMQNAIHSTKDIIQGIKDGKAYYAEMPEVKKALKQLGYDGMITQESKFGANYGVWNKDVIKTKSQLTDIYNKAVGGNIPKAVKEKQVKILSSIPDEDLSFSNKNAQIDFYNTDKDRAFRIVTGKEAVPEGINPKALYRLLSNEASDGEMINKLANSKLPYEAGADLSMLNIGDRTNSVVDVVREANITLRKTLDPKAAKKAIAELAEEIRVNKPTLEELKVLIKEITC